MLQRQQRCDERPRRWYDHTTLGAWGVGFFYDGDTGDFLLFVGHGCDRPVQVDVELLDFSLVAAVLGATLVVAFVSPGQGRHRVFGLACAVHGLHRVPAGGAVAIPVPEGWPCFLLTARELQRSALREPTFGAVRDLLVLVAGCCMLVDALLSCWWVLVSSSWS